MSTLLAVILASIGSIIIGFALGVIAVMKRCKKHLIAQLEKGMTAAFDAGYTLGAYQLGQSGQKELKPQ